MVYHRMGKSFWTQSTDIFNMYKFYKDKIVFLATSIHDFALLFNFIKKQISHMQQEGCWGQIQILGELHYGLEERSMYFTIKEETYRNFLGRP